MKQFTVLFLMLISLPVLTAKYDREILRCLGDEERRFHLKKETGPSYDLNQRLISELLQIPSVEITSQDYLSVCTGQNRSESWKLLELSLRKGKKLFVISEEVQGMRRGMAEGMIEDYVLASKEILLQFLASIQTISPSPTCLKEEIPELENFYTRIKYLESDIDLTRIVQGKDQKIFDKLKNYRLAFEKCRARLKKKESSSSTAAPKKL